MSDPPLVALSALKARVQRTCIQLDARALLLFILFLFVTSRARDILRLIIIGREWKHPEAASAKGAAVWGAARAEESDGEE
eukprot:1666493-Rhodomonas_salina.1